MKIRSKFLIILLTVVILTACLNVKASTGYTYDHRGQPIYSTTGLTVNQAPYLATNLGIDMSYFTSPEDMFIFTEESGKRLIYIVDSASNKLFVLDDKLKLIEKIDSFKVDVSKFSDETLNAIKSAKKYVIARDMVFSIKSDMEKINLDVDASKVIEYAVSSSYTKPYVIEWTSSDNSVATVTVSDTGIPTITAKKVGQATITGTFNEKTIEEETDPDTGETVQKEVLTKLATVTILVSSDPEKPLEIDEKNNTFTMEELKGKGTFQLHLGGVTGVYRAINPKTHEDYIYLCDKGNNQIVVINSQTYEVVQFVTTPQTVTFEGKQFSPSKLVTDTAGRMYVIADNIYEGIMQFSKEGEFNRFTGVNYVTLTPWEVFWRNISTDSQLSKQNSIINTSFTSLTVDDKGFIYTTSYATTNSSGMVTNDNAMIKKINTAGKDVMRRNGYQPPKGDVVYIPSGTKIAERGASKLTGITVNDYGMYTVVDSKMGKLFTYDNEGKLLYISGEALYIQQEKGKQINVLSAPVAVRYLDDNILVLDKNNSAIIVFEPTDIGKLINEAARYEFLGDSVNASLTWEKVIKLNANYEYGYIGIGKKYMNEKDYKTAMEYFEKGADRDMYSKAYKLYRDGKIRKFFAPAMGIILFIVAARYVYRIINRKKYRKEEDTGMGDE